MASIKTIHEDCDILIVGGGMAGTGATFEARHWGRDLKIVCVEKYRHDKREDEQLGFRRRSNSSATKSKSNYNAHSCFSLQGVI